MPVRRGIVIGRICAGVVVRHSVVRLLRMIGLHAVVFMLGHDLARTRPLTFRAQHGRSHRAPNGEQHGQEQQDENAQVFHVRGLSGKSSMRAGEQKFHWSCTLYRVQRWLMRCLCCNPG